MNKTKDVNRGKPAYRGDYNNYKIYATHVSVYRYTDGICTGGSDRTEWSATNGIDVVEARTKRELISRIDLM